MKLLKKIPIFFLLTALVGCSMLQTDNISQTKPQKHIAPQIQEATQEETASPKKTQIVFARTIDSTNATLQIVNDFNAKQEDIVVKYQELPSNPSQLYNYYLTLFQSNSDEIDVLDSNAIWSASFANSGFISPIDGFIERDKINLNAYNKGSIDALRYNNKIWGMPKYLAVNILFFRTDIVNSSPKTWDELLTASNLLAGKNGTLVGFDFSGRLADDMVYFAMELMNDYGGFIVSQNGHITINSKNATLGLAKLKEIYNSKVVSKNIYKYTEADAAASFFSGNSIFMRNWSSNWAVGKGQNSKVFNKFAIASSPAGDNSNSNTISVVASMINKNSKFQDESWEFIKYMTGFEGEKIGAVVEGKTPTLKSVLVDKDVLVVNPHFALDSFKKSVEDAVSLPVTDQYAKFSEIMQDEIYNVINGKTTPEETANNLETKLNFLLNNK